MEAGKKEYTSPQRIKGHAPNVCAAYTQKDYRCQKIAGQLLDLVVKDMKSKRITPLYLITDHTGFYERYG